MRRNRAIDALKGVAITLVVLSHAILSTGPLRSVAMNPLLSIAYAFQVPLFFYASGLVLWSPVRKPLRIRLSGRAQSLLVPYLAWFCVIYAFQAALGEKQPPFARNLAFALVNSNANATLWFLYALFVSSVLLIAIDTYAPAVHVIVASAALSALLWGVVPLRTNYFALAHTLELYPFLALGYLTRWGHSWFRQHRRVIALVCLPTFALMAWLEYPMLAPVKSVLGTFDTLLHGLGIPGSYTIAFYIGAGCAALGLYALYLSLPVSVLSAQAWGGRRTLGVYAAHDMFITAAVMVGIEAWPVIFAFALVSALLVTLILERASVTRRVLLGKRDAIAWSNAHYVEAGQVSGRG